MNPQITRYLSISMNRYKLPDVVNTNWIRIKSTVPLTTETYRNGITFFLTTVWSSQPRQTGSTHIILSSFVIFLGGRQEQDMQSNVGVGKEVENSLVTSSEMNAYNKISYI